MAADMALTGRMKLLLAVAAAVLVYVVATKPDEAVEGAAAPAGRARPQAAASVAPGAAGAAGAGQGPAGARQGSGRNVSSAGNDESARLYAQLSHRVSEGPSASALFQSTSWYTAPPPPPPVAYVAPVAVAPPAPVAPPLPFAIMGSYSRPGDSKVYFLTRGDRVFDVRVGDTIDNTYSVDRETGGQLQFTYKPLNIQQSLPLGGSQ
jgi:hypothetical protein